MSSAVHNMMITYSKCVHVAVYRHVVKLLTDTDACQALYYTSRYSCKPSRGSASYEENVTEPPSLANLSPKSPLKR